MNKPPTPLSEKQIPIILVSYGCVERGRRCITFEKVKTPSGRILFSLSLQVDTTFRKRLLFDLEAKGDLAALLQKGRYEPYELNAGRENRRQPGRPPRAPRGERGRHEPHKD